MNTLRILLTTTGKTLSLKVDLETIVYDICRDLYTRISNHVSQPMEEFGLFVPDSDSCRAYWLDNSKPVCYYPLGDTNLVIEFTSRLRRLTVRTMDGTKKILTVDDSKTVDELILPICNKMGISNHEEYSLILELDEEEKMKTMTLRRGKNQVRSFEKLEKMKQKLKTDDELNWLPHAKTLRQIGIDNKSELLLRRKYFFSDQNIDARDPIQLNLLYVQLHNAIIDGTHPVSIEEAIKLAGIKCQAELGNFTVEKQKSIHFNWKDYIPKEYIKTKGIDKRIFQEHEKLVDKSDREAKVLYAQLCRSLKTYGITFFLVKEKMVAKNKMVPRLLGISKENIMRVDEKTKETIQCWPLTTVRRYAATASLFSLDFGDYADENYVIQTTDGEKIAQLIAGYIDIIIKKQKVVDQLVTETEEETTIIEENVSPSKANIISHNVVERNHMDFSMADIENKTQVGHRNSDGVNRVTFGEIDSPPKVVVRQHNKLSHGRVHAPTQRFQVMDLNQPKRALMMRIGDNLKMLKAATEDLSKHIEVTKIGDDESSRIYRQETLDIVRSKIKSNLMSMSMATGSLLTMIEHENDSDDNQDYGRLDTAVTTIGYNTEQLLANVHKAYGMMQDPEYEASDGGHLINAAKHLLLSFQDLLAAARPIRNESDLQISDELGDEDGQTFSSKNLFEAVNRVGEASRGLLKMIFSEQNKTSEAEWDAQDSLLTDAKQIANAVSGMVKLAKEVSVAMKDTADPEAQRSVIEAAKAMGQAASILISSAKVHSCSMEQPMAQQQLLTTAKQVVLSVEEMIQVTKPWQSTYENIFQQLEDHSAVVYGCADRLKQQLAANSIIAHQDSIVARLLSASERLPAAIGNSSEMITQGHILAQAGSDLVNCLKSAAGICEGEDDSSSEVSLDSDTQRRLINAAKTLSDAVGKLLKATKMCSKQSEQSLESQQDLISAAKHMTSVAHMTAGAIIRQRVSKGLEFAGRQTAMTADQLISSSQEAAKMIRDSTYQICCDAQEMTDSILPGVILTCSKSRQDPTDTKYQNDLLTACQRLMKGLEQLLASSEALGPRVQDVSLQSALNASMEHSQTSLSDLKQCVQQAEIVLKPTDVTNLCNLEAGQFQTLHSWMDSAAQSAFRGLLYPLPGESAESVSAIVGNSSRVIPKTLDNMYDVLSSMNIDFSDDVSNVNIQPNLLKCAKELMDSLGKFLRGTRGIAALKYNSVPEESIYDKQIGIINSGKQVLHSAEDVINGVQLSSIGAITREELKESMEKMKDDLSVIVRQLHGYEEIESLIDKLTLNMRTFGEIGTANPRISGSSQRKSHSQLQSEFKAALVVFNQTSADLTNCSQSVLPSLTSQLNESHRNLLDSGKELIKEAPGNEKQLDEGLHAVFDHTIDFLSQLKNLLLALGSPDFNALKQSLLKASRSITERINDLLSVCADTLPATQQQCYSSQRQLEALKANMLTEPPSMPISDRSYAECLSFADQLSQEITDLISRISVACKSGDSDDFCRVVRGLTSSTIDMLKVSTQANYQLGIIESGLPNDPQSNCNDLIEALEKQSRSIKDLCIQISSESFSDLKSRDLATEVKRGGSAVCQLVKDCINNTTDKQHQDLLLDAGKRVAEATANLIQAINSTPRQSLTSNTDPCTLDILAIPCKVVSNSVDDLLRVSRQFPIEYLNITEQGRQAQNSIFQASVEVVDGSVTLLRAADLLVKDSQSHLASEAFIINQKTFNNASNRLYNLLKYSFPGQKAFIEMEEEIKQLLHKLDNTNMMCPSSTSSIAPISRQGGLLNNDIQRVQCSLKLLRSKIPAIELVLSDKKRLQYLGSTTKEASNYLDPIIEVVVRLGARLPHSRDRGEILVLSKTVLEAFLVLVQGCQIRPENVHEEVSSLKEGCEDLSKFVDSIAISHGNVEGMITMVKNSMSKLHSVIPSNGGDISSAHTSIVQTAKSILEVLTGIVKKDSNCTRLQRKETMRSVDENRLLGQENQTDAYNPIKRLVTEYDNLVLGVNNIFGKDVFHDKLITIALAIGQSCMDLIRYDQPEFAVQVRGRVSDLLFALQSNSKGIQCCIAAANKVAEMVRDLDTAIMFASSGTLALASNNASNEAQELSSMSKIKEQIFKITRSLISDLQQMLISVNGGQEHLAMMIENAVRHADQLCNAVRSSATVLEINPGLIGLIKGGPDCSNAQTLLLNSARDVAVALVEFFNFTKANVAVTDVKDKERCELKNSLMAMVRSVDGLIKSVKSLEDSGQRGTRALEGAIEAMKKENTILEMWNIDEENINNMSVSEDGTENLTPSSLPIKTVENLIIGTKQLMTASRMAVTAAQTLKQEDILVAANAGRKAVQDLSHSMRVTVSQRLQEERYRVPHMFNGSTHSESVKECLLNVSDHGKGAVKGLIDMYEHLYKSVSEANKDGPSNMQVKLASRRIALSIHELTECASRLKGTNNSNVDNTVLEADDELLEAVSQIEAAAKKLSKLQPRKSEKKESDVTELTFEGQIINACGSIVSATQLLVSLTTDCQQELVTQGRMKPSGNINDQTEKQWSHGLISAARVVAAATENLSDSAKDLVQGGSGTERLISASKQVAAGTVHLLVACRVKSDADSVSNQRLQEAGAAVMKATEMLVKEASGEQCDDDKSLRLSYGTVNKSMVSSMRNVIEAQADIVAKENELVKLRNKYNTIRQEQISTYPGLYDGDRDNL